MKPLDETQNHSTKLKTGMLEGGHFSYMPVFLFSYGCRLSACMDAEKPEKCLISWDFRGFMDVGFVSKTVT